LADGGFAGGGAGSGGVLGVFAVDGLTNGGHGFSDAFLALSVAGGWVTSFSRV
jgi:hypothetical protein